MKKKNWRAAGVLAAVMLCESLFFPGLAGVGAGLLKVQAEGTNVALNKTVVTSGDESDTWTGDKAVDGDLTSDAGRWSSGDMSGGEAQWLVIDLAAEETVAESIRVYFNAKAWSTKYRIETSDTGTEDAEWTCVYELPERESAASPLDGPDVMEASDMSTNKLKRYVRFYFEKRNLEGWKCLSVREIEIIGTQSSTLESAADVLNRISTLTVSKEDTTLQIPDISDHYDISVYGSEVECVIGEDGSISACQIGERTVNLILKAENKTNPADTARKSFTVKVPDHTFRYPELFPDVENPNPVPDVLPTIQEWYGYEGDFELTEQSKIVVNDAAHVGLLQTAKEMCEDLQDICGFSLDILEGTDCGACDIYLESQKEDSYDVGAEGYFLVNGDEGIRIYSSTNQGILYGTVTVEQILYQDVTHTRVPKGVIRDYPLYEVRGIMMDVARIPTRMQFLEDYTKIFKWYKLNEIQLHLNDNQWSDPAYQPDYASWEKVEASHRLYSETFPSLALQDSKFESSRDYEGRYDYYYSTHTGTGGELYYSKEEYKKLQTDAKNRGISLVAELDTPSHSAAYTKYVYSHQEEVIRSLTEKGYLDSTEYLNEDGSLKEGAAFYIHHTYPNGNFELLAIDTESSNAQEKKNAENARIFMTALFDEYLSGEDPLFTASAVSAGVDEYWDKSNKEAFRSYMNFMNDLLGKDGYGKEVRMWGALSLFPGNTEVSKDITLEIWNCTEDDPIARIRDGFHVINIPQPYLYTTPGRYHKDMIREQYVYDTWTPLKFNESKIAEKGEPMVKGAMAALWGDENREGITEADLNERYLRLAAMVSEKTWGGTKEEDTYLEYAQTFDRLREGPGTQIANNIESITNVVLNYDFENMSADGQIVYDQSGNGYDGIVTNGQTVWMFGEKWMKFDGSTVIETPLTSLGYPYTISFDIYLDEAGDNTDDSALFGGYDGRLQVAGRNGALGLNRDYFTQSFDYKVNSGEKHRITITGTYGVTKLYVDGVFTKILYAAASDPESGGNVGASTWKDMDDNYRTTFVFPLNRIGENFTGYLGNIKAYQKALFPEELEAEEKTEILEADVARNCGSYSQLGNSSFWGDQMRLYPAWKATDGDGHVPGATTVSTFGESRWNSSDRDSDFLLVDLGQTRKISKVVIDWQESRYAADYEIQVSNDQETWRTVRKVTGNTSAWTEDNFEQTEARYVKMQGVRRKAGSNEYSIYEIKVYESVDKTELAAVCKETRELLNRRGIGWESSCAGKELQESCVKAEAVWKDVLAGQEETDEAAKQLKQEKEKWSSSFTASDTMIRQTEQLLKNASFYEEATWQRMLDAYHAVKNAPTDIQADEYAKRVTVLKGALEGLEKKKTEETVIQLMAPVVRAVKSQPVGVKVTWSTSSNAQAYQLYRKTGNKVVKIGDPVKGTMAVDPKPEAGKENQYYVIALSNGQKGYLDSAAGAEKTVRIPKTSAKVTATLVKGKKAVDVKWKKVKGTDAYLIYRAEGKNGSWKKIGTVKNKKPAVYRDTRKLKKGKTYYYRVVTVSSKKYSPMKPAKKAVKIK